MFFGRIHPFNSWHLVTERDLTDNYAFYWDPFISWHLILFFLSQVIDWKRFSLRIYEHDLPNLDKILREVSPRRVHELQSQGRWVYRKYFRSMTEITLTTLEILHDRLYPQLGKSYMDWNVPSRYVWVKLLMFTKTNSRICWNQLLLA